MNESTNLDESTWQPVKGQLMTRWVKDIDHVNPLPEYPRPQLVRKDWLNLNGSWDYAIRPKKEKSLTAYDGKILVPFPLESALSGVKKKLSHKYHLFYRRYFRIPENWKGRRIILHFGAVDWETTVKVNGKNIGFHRGGFVPFSFDITGVINHDTENELEVMVWDPTDKGRQERGKQSLKPFTAFYNAVSGIWQTVWLEPVSEAYIKNIRVIPDIDHQIVSIKVNVENIQQDDTLAIEISADKVPILTTRNGGITEFSLSIPDPKLWSPSSPFLYDLTITLSRDGSKLDEIRSYFGMRKIALVKDEENIPRIQLNNQPLFQYGPLDQGYWPDGLYTAPTDEALKFDIEITKEMGFNFIRKHVKVEPARWYYHCDRLGMPVWQDMPNGGIFSLLTMKILSRGRRKKSVREQFKKELAEMIDYLHNFPSVIVWVPFNEGWGQFETEEITEQIRKQDSSRLIDAASGWFDKKVGDIKDIHKYPGPAMPRIEEKRAAVLGEFGGLGYKADGHFWTGKKLYWSYSKSESVEEMKEKYERLLVELKPMIKDGLCAAVYTQTTDVEGEINGFLTYDREILKMDKEYLKNLHKELLSL
ncbi:MAG: glycoside hydrolase family 2 protein [Candidatus Hodarchaeales archaeon]|jgi:beta-galactosidase/beta-glucuronidase